jgi:hypothetical protein
MIPKLSSSAIALALTFSHPVNPAIGESDFAVVRAATARFQDVNVAIAEGYVRDPMSACDAAQMIGRPIGTGVHYFRPDLLDDKTSANGARGDRGKPGILIYEPRPDGSLELVAVEELKLKWAWREAGEPEQPKINGAPNELMADNPATKINEAQMFEPHYDRHVWIFRDNPREVFASFNRNANCRADEASTTGGPQPDHSGAR